MMKKPKMMNGKMGDMEYKKTKGKASKKKSKGKKK